MRRSPELNGDTIFFDLGHEEKPWVIRRHSFNPLAPHPIAYTVGRALGIGGLSQVFQGLPQDADNLVAVKTAPHIQAEQALLKKEARLQASLRHPNLPQYLDFIQDIHPPGTPETTDALVMELVGGPSLDTLITNRVQLPISHMAEITRQVGHLLTDLYHRQGVLIRDLKPEHIIVGEHIYLLDLGGSNHVFDESSGYLIITPKYASPEAFADRANMSLRSDVFSLGVITYMMLAHVWPYDLTPSEMKSTPSLIMYHILRSPHLPLSHHPRIADQFHPETINRLERCFTSALAKNPSQRQPTPAQFGEEFADALLV